eukprot:Skav204819  [mRNA]  locus=scaffold3914:193702:194039:- [translate_table: standard]
MPYSDGRDYWKDPKMREFYEQYYKNFSRNGTNYSEWFRTFLRGLPTEIRVLCQDEVWIV